MRATALLHALPPLPPRSTWTAAFPRPSYSLSSPLNPRLTPNRVTLASPELCQEFVKELDLKPDEVVLEAYSGPGVLTRSLLEAKPKRVIALEPSGHLITHPHGLAFSSEALTEAEARIFGRVEAKSSQSIRESQDGSGKRRGRPKKTAAVSSVTEDDAATIGDPSSPETLPEESPTLPATGLVSGGPAHLLDSTHDPKLSLLPSSAYDWETWTKLLQHPVFSGVSSEVVSRKWRDTPPNLRFVAQIPDSVVGEQLISQWIALIPRRGWLFEFGRMRLDLLVSPSLFDRLVAQPDSKTNCKLSVFTAALCHTTLLPPYHLDPHQTTLIPSRKPRKDYRKPHLLEKRATTYETKTKGKKAKAHDPLAGYPFSIHPPTPTMTNDFHPLRSSTVSSPLARPALVGISLTPCVDSVITSDNKDAWDYVLRNLFVQNAKALKMGIPILGPGAENLLPLIEDPPQEWNVVPVDPARLPRSFNVDEWATVVKAFENWAFKPTNLTLVDTAGDEQWSRGIGSGM